jgi:RNA polymerase sigma-70 factor (ECF subfamily)
MDTPKKPGDAADSRHDYLDEVRRHDGLIRKVSRLYAHTPEDRLDLAQEIRLQLWRAWTGYTGEAKRTTWMYRVALNTALTFQRREGRRPVGQPLENLDVADPASRDGKQRDQRQALIQALGRLEPGERALALLWLEECSYKEIASISGLSVNVVGVRLHRVRERLKVLLGGGAR